MNEVWRVQLATGEVRMMSLDELDRAFDAGWIHERTNVLAPGSFKWTTLGDAAGLNEPEPQPYVEQTPSLAPMAIAGSQYSLPNIPQHHYASSMSSFGLDDEDFGAKKSKKGGRGQTIASMIELAAAAAGLVSLAYELMQRHQAGSQQHANPPSTNRETAEGHRPLQASDHEPSGSLLGKAGVALGAAGELIDVNPATPEVLRALQPLGKKRAKRIVARRPFKNVKQLKRVLPKDVYRTIRHQLTV